MRILDRAERSSILPTVCVSSPLHHHAALRITSRILLYTAIFVAISLVMNSGFTTRRTSPSSLLNEEIIISTIHMLLYPTLYFHFFWCFLRSSLPILANCTTVYLPPSCSMMASDPGPIVHEGQKRSIPHVQGEPVSGTNSALVAWFGEPFRFCRRRCFFDTAYQKIKLLERYADSYFERADIL